MSNVKAQTKEEIRAALEQTCKMMAPYMIDEELKEQFEIFGITEDCYCNAFVETMMEKLLPQLEGKEMTMEIYMKIMQKLIDETTPEHVEFAAYFTSVLEKKCANAGMFSSSVTVKGPSKGTISLSKYGTMHKIKVTIGKSEKYFTMDTGADNSLITKSYARELEDMNLIQPKDYIEPAEYIGIHDKKAVLHKRVQLNNIRIGDFTLDNVILVIGNDDSSGLLLGKDILNAFQSWNINNNNSTLELVK
jgi:predicted aspartyl protease